MVSRDYAPMHATTQCISHKQLDLDLRSNYGFTITLNWLSICLDRHENCPSKKESLLHTRVIEVNSDITPRLVLSKGAQGEYAALSCC